jgi:hypothetical protein
MDRVFARPQTSEHFDNALDYVSLVPQDGRLLRHMEDSLRQMEAFVRVLPLYRLTVPHATGEWTVQDVLQHIADNERVFAYRMLRIARGDTTTLPGYDQEPYAVAACANDRTLDDLWDEYVSVRRASITLLRSLSDEALARSTDANGHVLTARAAAHIIVGHEQYHLRSLRENYGR